MTSKTPYTNPYKGLVPYSEEDALFFFGRENEQEMIIASLEAFRLTVVYGASGVGKSSVLRAGIVNTLQQSAKRNLERRGAPEVCVVYFNSWRDDPVAALKNSIRYSALKSLGGRRPDSLPSGTLAEVIRGWAEIIGGDLFIILDQFEECFFYHRTEFTDESFYAEFARAVNEKRLRASFLISLREDALAGLDRLKGRIPTLFNHILRIGDLSYESARTAIIGPIEQYNRLSGPAAQPLAVEHELVDEVLNRFSAKVSWEDGLTPSSTQGEIKTPFLQLVMSRLWEEEMSQGSRLLRLDTLQQLGGAERIVASHVDSIMNKLSPDERDDAAHIFRFLITPSGAKNALSARDLAVYSSLPEDKVAVVLNRLSGANARILHKVTQPIDQQKDIQPANQSAEDSYEIVHDLLAAAILGWMQKYEMERVKERQKFELDQVKNQQRRERARFARSLAIMGMLIIAFGGISAYAFSQRSRAIEQRVSAERLQVEAEQERNEAEEARLYAEKAQKNLTVALGESENARSIIAKERAIALEQSKLAKLARDEAITQRKRAQIFEYVALKRGEEAKLKEDELRSEIDKLKSDAEIAKQEAERIRKEHLLAAEEAEKRIKIIKEQLESSEKSGAEANLRAELAEKEKLAAAKRNQAFVAELEAMGKKNLVSKVDAILRNAGPTTTYPKATLGVFNHPVLKARFAPAGDAIFIASADNTVRVFDSITMKQKGESRVHTKEVQDVAISPDGKLVATASRDTTVRLWDAALDKEVSSPLKHPKAVRAAVFSPDSKLIATACEDKRARVWGTDGNAKPKELKHGGNVNGAAFSPNGKFLVTADDDKKARIWDLENSGEAKPLELTDDVNSVDLSSDGKLLVTASDNDRAQIWDFNTRQMIAELRGHTHDVTAAAFSPDGRFIVTASKDKTARLWDVSTKKVVALLRGHNGEVYSADFSRDGKYVVTASKDGTVRLWDVNTGASLGVLHHDMEKTRGVRAQALVNLFSATAPRAAAGRTAW